MCSLAPVDQNRLFPSFEPSIESSFSLHAPHCNWEKDEFLDSPFFLPLRAKMAPYHLPFSEGENKDGCESFAYAALVKKNGMPSSPSPTIRKKKSKRAEASFQFHKEYIKKRVEETASESVSTKKLLEEIKAKGYEGTLRTVQTFVSLLKEKQGAGASFRFHKEYIKKRVEESVSKYVPPRQLFEEIRANGYLGAYSTVVTFVSLLREKKGAEASLQFHKEYIRKRMEETASKYVPPRQLLEEIKAKGYRGTLRMIQTFVSMIRTSRSPEASLQFHKKYITKKVEEVIPESVSVRKLFEEIQVSGYLGSYDTVRAFVSTLREKKNQRAEESFQFHKEYITKRLEEAISESVSPRQLFEEIKANGYLGAFSTVRAFVSTIREKKNKRPEASLQFHKEYIKKRLEEAALEYVSAKQLFEEIKAKGYQGTLKTTQVFLSTIRTSSPPETSLQFHKEYIKRRVGEAACESVSKQQIFKEIKANGYLGAYNTVAAFISTVRKIKAPKASLQFHKRYIIERLKEPVSKQQIFKEIKANGYLGAYNTVATFISTIRKIKAPEASFQLHKDFLSK